MYLMAVLTSMQAPTGGDKLPICNSSLDSVRSWSNSPAGWSYCLQPTSKPLSLLPPQHSHATVPALPRKRGETENTKMGLLPHLPCRENGEKWRAQGGAAGRLLSSAAHHPDPPCHEN